MLLLSPLHVAGAGDVRRVNKIPRAHSLRLGLWWACHTQASITIIQCAEQGDVRVQYVVWKHQGRGN